MKVLGAVKLSSAVALVALLAGPAYAQAPAINLMPEVVSKTPEQKEADAVRDKAYRESLKKIPDAKGTSDPWGSVRAPDAPKASAKSRTRTGATVN